MFRFALSIVLALAVIEPMALGQAPTSGPANTPALASPPAPSIVGTIRYHQKVFRLREVLWPLHSRGQDVVLERILVGKKILDESLLINPRTKGVANCAIFLDDLELPIQRPALVLLAVKDLAMNKRVVLLRPGGRIRIQNQDKQAYRFAIREDGKIKREFELAIGSNLDLDLPPAKRLELVEKKFSFIKTVVFQPQWLPALITGENGDFAIAGLAPGETKLTIHHEVLGTWSKTVNVRKDIPTVIDIQASDFLPRRKPYSLAKLLGESNPVLRIDGTLVSRAVFKSVLDFVRLRYDDFPMPESALKRYIVTGVFIPLVASLVFHEKELSALEKRQKTIDDGLRQGKTLGQMAKAVGARFLNGEESWIGRRDVAPWLGARVFSSPKNLPIGPIFGSRGMHYVLVTDVRGRGAAEERRFSHLFIRFSPETSETDLNELKRALSDRARVEALEPSLEPLIPEDNRR